MERLTKRNENKVAILNVKCPEGCEYSSCSMEEGYQCQHQCEGDIIEKLAQYEDAEEQGLLLRLPCHIGDIIYEPTNRNTINEYRVTGIKEEAFALWIEWKLEKGFVYQSIYGVEVGDIGKTVFLTQAEAEQKLKEMESE